MAPRKKADAYPGTQQKPNIATKTKFDALEVQDFGGSDDEPGSPLSANSPGSPAGSALAASPSPAPSSKKAKGKKAAKEKAKKAASFIGLGSKEPSEATDSTHQADGVDEGTFIIPADVDQKDVKLEPREEFSPKPFVSSPRATQNGTKVAAFPSDPKVRKKFDSVEILTDNVPENSPEGIVAVQGNDPEDDGSSSDGEEAGQVSKKVAEVPHLIRTQNIPPGSPDPPSRPSSAIPPPPRDIPGTPTLEKQGSRSRLLSSKNRIPSPSPSLEAFPNVPQSAPLPPSKLSQFTGPDGSAAPTKPTHGTDHSNQRSVRLQSIITRTVWTLVMVAGFITLLFMGHAWMIVLVFGIQTTVFRELCQLFSQYEEGKGEKDEDAKGDKAKRERAESDRSGKVFAWYFFIAANYFLYGESIIYYFKHIILVDAYVLPFARHHRFISFMLYTFGFVSFVANLKRGQLRRQFGLFCWIHMSLMLIVFSCHFIVNNILEGMIWFWVPCSLVIINDIAAYVFGMLFGRTQLIKLSPKKTVEGFVGAFFATIIFAYFWASFFMRWNYMICPARDLGTTAFSEIECQPNPVFIWHDFPLPDSLSIPLSTTFRHPITHFAWAPFQIHAVIMSIFASLVAPFGGFFASGFKRAFNIKDFGDSIPGHGGLTDRMDCQFLMGLFSYVYYSSIIRVQTVTVGAVLGTIVNGLTPGEQVELFVDLKKYLIAQGIQH